MLKKITALLDIARLQKLMDALYEAAGIPSAIVDKDLTILTAMGWQDSCEKFQRLHPETLQKCTESENPITQILHPDSGTEYHDKDGMLDYACPIVIEDEHLATLLIGQFFSETPQEEFFRQQAKKCGVDEEEYIASLQNVPVITKERLRLINIFFVELAQFIGDMGMKNFKQVEMVTLLQALMNAIPNTIFYKDVKGIYQGCNKAFADFLGIPQEKIIGSSVYDLSPRELAIKYEVMDAELFNNPRVQVYEYQAVNGYGEKREFIFNKAPYLDLDQHVAGLVGIMIDITQKKELEIALKNSERKYRALFNNLFDGFVYFRSLLDEKDAIVDYQILEVNSAFEKLVKLTKAELVGKRVSEVTFSPQNVSLDWIKMFKDVSSSGESKTIEYFSNLLGIWFLVSAYSSQPGYCAIVVSDISEQKEKIERAQHYAYHDPLTGLPNRRLFDDRLSLSIAQGQKDKEIIGVIFLDLDKFKAVNDTLGHEGGDLLLKEVARRLENCIREGDTASRIGGDEFVLILPNLKDCEEADQIVTRILEQCRQPFRINQHVVEISASMGISFFPQDGDDVTSLTRNADIAMYLCKDQGRNGICYSNKCNFTSKAEI